MYWFGVLSFLKSVTFIFIPFCWFLYFPWALLSSCSFWVSVVRSSYGKCSCVLRVNFQGWFCMLSSWECVRMLHAHAALRLHHWGNLREVTSWESFYNIWAICFPLGGTEWGLDISCIIYFSVPWRSDRWGWGGGVSGGNCFIEGLICKQGWLHNLWSQCKMKMVGLSSKSRKNVPLKVP